MRALEPLLSSFPGAIGLTDMSGVFVYVNRRFERLFGYDPGELLGRPGYILNAPSDEDPGVLTEKINEAMAAVGMWEGEVHCKRRDGALFWTKAKLSRFEHPELGSLWLGMQEDITEQKSIELQLLQAQKMEALGVMAGGIAHEFNNVLAIMQGKLELMQLDETLPAPLRRDLEALLETSEHGAEIVRQILMFSRKQPVEKRRVDAASVVARAREFVTFKHPSAEVHVEVAAECGAINASPTQLHQVCVNLLNNALQSLPPSGGVVTIAGAQLRPEELPARVEHLSLRRAASVFRLTVRDNGAGIEERHISRIFDPFFSTKAGSGSGLGLSIVARIVANHEGQIFVDSELGEGTLFTVYLPGFDASTPSAGAAVEHPEKPDAAHILIVEDQVPLASVFAEYFSTQGYKTTVCHDGREALRRFEASPTAFDVILSDVEIPGVNGYELARRIRQRDGAIPIVLSSGYTDTLASRELVRSGAVEFFAKPVSLRKLQKGIERLLERYRTR